MQELILVLPGISPGEIYGMPMKGRGLPSRIKITAEPWDVIRVDFTDSPMKIYSLFSPKKIMPNQKLIKIYDDLIIGKGQKAIIPAQPASGKTYILTSLGERVIQSRKANVTNLMIDERPEEKLAGPNVININLSYMRAPKDILEGVLETMGKVMRKVTETGSDEVIFIDSLTRLVEVTNTVIRTEFPDLPSGTGGISLEARKFVRQILGLGNNFQKGSLTIVATCLVGGSTIEDTIYKDLKGVSNAELFIKAVSKGNAGIDPKKSYVRQQKLIR